MAFTLRSESLQTGVSSATVSSLLLVFADKFRGRIKFITYSHESGQGKPSLVGFNLSGRVASATPSDFEIKTMVTEILTKKSSLYLFQFVPNHKMHVTAEISLCNLLTFRFSLCIEKFYQKRS